MWTMQRDGDYVYVFSVRAGRQDGPMMLRRVRWDRLFYPESYEGWGWNGTNWGWGRPCTPSSPAASVNRRCAAWPTAPG